MPGKTKRKYQGENIRIAKGLNRPLELIMPTLKPRYTAEEVLVAFQKYYPNEWNTICERYQVYSGKDSFLESVGKKKRYSPEKPEEFFYSLPKVKYLLSDGYRIEHEEQYDEDTRLQYCLEFEAKRSAKIEKQQNSIENNTRGQQGVDPGFLDALIYAYHREGNTTNDKLEIFKEIQKYDCNKAREFFWKLNDSERNAEIRKLAFSHLQDTGHYVMLRKGFTGRKKSYMTEKSNSVGTPEALAHKLRNSKSVQGIKHYDLFVSHSYKDREIVRGVVANANKAGLNCYVDWNADDNFLKRDLVSEFTKEVLKARMEHSDKLLFVSSENSRASEWVAFELQFYQEHVKNEILMVVIDGEDKHDFRMIDKDNLSSYFKDESVYSEGSGYQE